MRIFEVLCVWSSRSKGVVADFAGDSFLESIFASENNGYRRVRRRLLPWGSIVVSGGRGMKGLKTGMLEDHAFLVLRLVVLSRFWSGWQSSRARGGAKLGSEVATTLYIAVVFRRYSIWVWILRNVSWYHKVPRALFFRLWLRSCWLTHLRYPN